MSDLEKFIISRWMYSIGEPIMEDSEYQILLETVQKEYPDSEYLTRSWSSDPCPVNLLEAYGYSHAIKNIVLTDKSESIPSIGSWTTLRGMYEDLNEDATLSFKHDGWNIQASYYNGELVQIQTRGRSSDALSAEALRSKVPAKIDKLGKYTVCMEATVSNSNYQIVKSKITSRSQRGAVVSCLSRPDMVKYISLHAFSIIGDEQVMNPFPLLEQWGFDVVRYVVVKNYDELMKYMKQLSDEAQYYDWPTDGLVIRCSVTRAIRLLYWQEPIYKSYVTGYDESYGAYRISVKVKIKPIAMKNSTQRVVACTNYQCIIDNNLRIGYPVAYKLTSAAIAVLDAESTKLLQTQWKGKEDEYRKWIDEEENEKISDAGDYVSTSG